ncbi:unnamed protein product [Brassica rapa subsp. trilocularis]
MELPAMFFGFYSLMLRRSQQRSNLSPGYLLCWNGLEVLKLRPTLHSKLFVSV